MHTYVQGRFDVQLHEVAWGEGNQLLAVINSQLRLPLEPEIGEAFAGG